MEEHEHKYVFLNTVYWSGDMLPGSSVHERVYGDRFYCQKCLQYKIINERTIGNTYGPPLLGTTPR